MKEILAFLAIFNCHLTESDFVYVTGLSQRGFTHYGKAYVRSKEDGGIIVHEGMHVCQQKRWGIAKNYEEWQENEEIAHRIELIWIGRDK